MERLIDADALLMNVVAISNSKWQVTWSAVPTTSILTAPTVDAVEVVRCKDCIHYDFGVCLKIYSDGAVSQYAWQARNEDDFCSYGERRTDG